MGQPLDVFIVGVQGFEFIEQALLQCGDLGWLHAVFARQRVNGVEPLFEVLQATGVGIKVINEAIEFAHGFFNLNLRAGQQVGGFVQ